MRLNEKRIAIETSEIYDDLSGRKGSFFENYYEDEKRGSDVDDLSANAIVEKALEGARERGRRSDFKRDTERDQRRRDAIADFFRGIVFANFGEEDSGKDERSGREREYLELREKRRRRSFCDAAVSG